MGYQLIETTPIEYVCMAQQLIATPPNKYGLATNRNTTKKYGLATNRNTTK